MQRSFTSKLLGPHSHPRSTARPWKSQPTLSSLGVPSDSLIVNMQAIRKSSQLDIQHNLNPATSNPHPTPAKVTAILCSDRDSGPLLLSPWGPTCLQCTGKWSQMKTVKVCQVTCPLSLKSRCSPLNLHRSQSETKVLLRLSRALLDVICPTSLLTPPIQGFCSSVCVL